MIPTAHESITLGLQPPSEELASVRQMLLACMQCGTCSSSCPNEFAMDHTPRVLWRMVLMGREQEIFDSQTFTLCSACYCCTLRCPRGLTLTEVMAALKQIAARRKLSRYRSSSLFYQKFIDSLRRHGRVREMEIMSLYLAAMKHPLLPLRFAALGFKLMRRGKVPLTLPAKGKRPLEAIFRAVEQLEAPLRAGRTKSQDAGAGM